MVGVSLSASVAVALQVRTLDGVTPLEGETTTVSMTGAVLEMTSEALAGVPAPPSPSVGVTTTIQVSPLAVPEFGNSALVLTLESWLSLYQA
jgi:hypothetical protein